MRFFLKTTDKKQQKEKKKKSIKNKGIPFILTFYSWPIVAQSKPIYAVER